MRVILCAYILTLAVAAAACGGSGASPRPTDTAPGAASPVATSAATATTTAPVAAASPAGLRPMVAISAGHGGPHNIGAAHQNAQGVTDLVEKDLNLDIARRIDRMLRAEGYRTLMLRDGDYELSPEGGAESTAGIRAESQARADAADAAQADVLVVIHHNGSEDHSQSGTEVYFDPDRSFGDRSLKLATALHDGVVGALRALPYDVHDRGIKDDAAIGLRYGEPHTFLFGVSAGFRPTTMPAALVEGLFVTNDAEAALLQRDDVKDAEARGYVAGIDAYFAGP